MQGSKQLKTQLMQLRKESLENSGSLGFEPCMTSGDTGVVLYNQSSYKANCWQIVTKLVRDIPGKDEVIISMTFIYSLFHKNVKCTLCLKGSAYQ